ncbi:MAG TPA: hypothetical protein VMU68_11380 [Acidimicrobiales bacterium]|nr:hypothetical protein [Acidimicrobiales bacterium]
MSSRSTTATERPASLKRSASIFVTELLPDPIGPVTTTSSGTTAMLRVTGPDVPDRLNSDLLLAYLVCTQGTVRQSENVLIGSPTLAWGSFSLRPGEVRSVGLISARTVTQPYTRGPFCNGTLGFN